MKDTLITIYTTSEFMGNVLKTEGKLVKLGTKKYAQYDNAPFVSFVPKGKRKETTFLKGYKPYFLIIEGHNHPMPDDFLNAPIITDTLRLSSSRYSSFDERYKTDFDAMIDVYIEKNNTNILMDYRCTKQNNFIKDGI